MDLKTDTCVDIRYIDKITLRAAVLKESEHTRNCVQNKKNKQSTFL